MNCYLIRSGKYLTTSYTIKTDVGQNSDRKRSDKKSFNDFHAIIIIFYYYNDNKNNNNNNNNNNIYYYYYYYYYY